MSHHFEQQDRSEEVTEAFRKFWLQQPWDERVLNSIDTMMMVTIEGLLKIFPVETAVLIIESIIAPLIIHQRDVSAEEEKGRCAKAIDRIGGMMMKVAELAYNALTDANVKF